uniref:Uncharacterized protein n=1 Tax=Oryza punctata TaxID=4537 RepID=A0A0E0L2V9_ORYPU
MQAGSPFDPTVSALYSYLDSIGSTSASRADAVPTDEERVTLCTKIINSGTSLVVPSSAFASCALLPN